jgi:hypothetical protein
VQAANEKLARTTNFLEEEKARAEALLYRMSGLIACFPAGPNAAGAAAATADGKQPTPPSSQSVLSFLESTIAQSQSQQLALVQQQLSSFSTSLPNKQSSALGELRGCSVFPGAHDAYTPVTEPCFDGCWTMFSAPSSTGECQQLAAETHHTRCSCKHLTCFWHRCKIMLTAGPYLFSSAC